MMEQATSSIVGRALPFLSDCCITQRGAGRGLRPVTPSGPDCIAWAEGAPALLRNGRPVNNDLQSAILAPGTAVMVSYGAPKAKQNALLCHPAIFHPMPSIAYRLARVAAGDGVAAVSLYSVSPHDTVAGHALLRAVNGDIWNER